jgi:hypothetical protein
MAEDERYCVSCKNVHFAAAWYERETDGRIEYLCGDAFGSLKMKGVWRQVFPAAD